MNKGLTKILIFSSLIGLGFLGTKLYNTVQAVKGLKYKILGIRLQDGTTWIDALSGGFTFILTVAIINESEETVPFNSLFVKVYLNKQFISDVAIPNGKPVPPKSTIKLDVDFTTSASQLNDILLNELSNLIIGKRLVARIVGTIKGAGIEMPVDELIVVNEMKALESHQKLMNS